MRNNETTEILGYSTLVLFIFSIVFFFMFLGSFRKSQRLEKELQETSNLLASSQDTLQHYKDKDGLNRAKISTLETYKVETLLELQAKDKSIQWLQEVVKNNKKEIKNPGDGAVVLETQVTVDTVYLSHTTEEEWGERYIRKGFEDEWLKLTYFIGADSSGFNLVNRNKYSIVLGTDKKGKGFADITNYNPYSEVETLRTYQLINSSIKPKTKKVGIGPSVGYYLVDGKFQVGAGVSLNYNLIRLW